MRAVIKIIRGGPEACYSWTARHSLGVFMYKSRINRNHILDLSLHVFPLILEDHECGTSTICKRHRSTYISDTGSIPLPIGKTKMFSNL
jgi:hypothetical protein